MPNARPSRITTSKHVSDELCIWREKHGIEEFRISVDRFAELIGIATEDVLGLINEIQVIESEYVTVQEFIDNEASDYELNKGDIVIFTSGRDTYSYIYNPLYSQGQNNSDNYSLLSYFRGPDYVVETVSNEDELYAAIDKINEVTAGEIFFANNIQLTKDLDKDLDNIKIEGNKKSLIMYQSDGSGGYDNFKIIYNLPSSSTSTEFTRVTFIGDNSWFSDSGTYWSESKTIFEVPSTAPSYRANLTFNECVFSNCIGFDGGETSSTYNIKDSRLYSGELRVVLSGGHFYNAFSGSSSLNLTDYPLTVYKNAYIGDVVTVNMSRSDFQPHLTGRWGNSVALKTDFGGYDAITTDGTFIVHRMVNSSIFGGSDVVVAGDGIVTRHTITENSSTVIPEGCYIDDIIVRKIIDSNDIEGFSIGISATWPTFFTEQIDIIDNDDISHMFTNKNMSSSLRNIVLYPLLNNLPYPSSDTQPLYFSADNFNGGTAVVDVIVKRYTPNNHRGALNGNGGYSTTSNIVKVIDVDMNSAGAVYDILPKIYNFTSFIPSSIKVLCSSGSGDTGGILSFYQETGIGGGNYTIALDTDTINLTGWFSDIMQHTSFQNKGIDLITSGWNATVQSAADLELKIIIKGQITK